MSEAALLRAESLTKHFAGFSAVNDVSLSVKRGDIHALIGPNGAGKTTCFNLLTKFLVPSAGRIYFKDKEITELSPDAVARKGVVRSFQISATFQHRTCLENVRMAVQRKRGESFDFWRSASVLRRWDDECMQLLEAFGLSGAADEPAHELSYGRKRALELATTLAMDPELMLLDEPLAGVGHEDIERVSALILQAARNRTVLMVEHNLPVVAALCNRVTVLARGQVLSEGDFATVSRDPRVVEAYMGADDD